MSYHVLVYCYEKVYRGNDIFLHLLTNTLESYDKYIELANNLIKKHVKEDIRVKFRYVGIEKLPIDAGSGHVLFASSPYTFAGFRVLEEEGSIDYNKLIEYKQRIIGADFDFEDIPQFVANAIGVMNRHWLESYQFYKTYRGAHLRIKLSTPIGFEERMDIRLKLRDDTMRRWYDRDLITTNKKFEGLTDMLFNQKYFITEDGSWQMSQEMPLTLNEIPLKLKLPKGFTRDYDFGKVVVDEKGARLIFNQPETPDDAVTKKIKVEDSLIDYSEKYQKEGSIKFMLTVLYAKISKRLGEVIDKSIIEFENDVVKIHVPEAYQNLIGRLIGKDGANIKSVQKVIGYKIVIVQPNLPEYVIMKKKLQDLMRGMV